MSSERQTSHSGLPGILRSGDGGKAPCAPSPGPCLFLWPWSLSSRMQTGLLSPAVHLRFWTLPKDRSKLACCLCLPEVQSSNGYDVRSEGWDPITSPLLFKGSLFSLPQRYHLHSAGKCIDTLVFTERPAGITGLVVIDHEASCFSILGNYIQLRITLFTQNRFLGPMKPGETFP